MVFLGHNWIAQIVLTTHIKQISVALLVIVIVANLPLEIKTKEDKLEAPITIPEDLLHHLIKDLDWPGQGIATTTTEALITIPVALITIPVALTTIQEALITIPEALITIPEVIVILVDPTTILEHQDQDTSDWIQSLTETANVEIAQHPVVVQSLATLVLFIIAQRIVIALDNRNVADVVEIVI